MDSLHERIRQFNKRRLNPLVVKIAGGRHSPVALVKHRGRTSGKEYRTPVLLKQVRGGFVLALTYGNKVDWYRNVVAAGGGTIRWHGVDSRMGAPVSIDREAGIRAFPPPLRVILRLNHTEHFIKMLNEANAAGK
ncbi:MAG: nitroreductase family deazaflavin-dependent oxidoreductase [Chloroflexota bacterium]